MNRIKLACVSLFAVSVVEIFVYIQVKRDDRSYDHYVSSKSESLQTQTWDYVDPKFNLKEINKELKERLKKASEKKVRPIKIVDMKYKELPQSVKHQTKEEFKGMRSDLTSLSQHSPLLVVSVGASHSLNPKRELKSERRLQLAQLHMEHAANFTRFKSAFKQLYFLQSRDKEFMLTRGTPVVKTRWCCFYWLNGLFL